MMAQNSNEMSGNARRFSSFMSGFAGNLSDEVEPETKVQPRPTEQLTGAQGLLQHQANNDRNNHRQPTDAIRLKKEALDRAHAQQADTQEKMKILMQNTQLWLQFKSRLAASNKGAGTVGVQTVLQEFLADHPEIEEQLKRDRAEAAQRMRDARGIRRISILETVSNLTSELSEEANPRSGSMGFNSSQRRSSNEQQRRSSNSSLGPHDMNSHSSHSQERGSFMGSATELGMNFLKRASAAATTSLNGSHHSFQSEGLDSSDDSIQRRGSFEVHGLNDAKPKANLSAFNEHDEDGYVTSDDEGGYLSTDEDENGFIDLTVARSKKTISRAA